jgi:aspartate/methionine/tyrosine aminotransferase
MLNPRFEFLPDSPFRRLDALLAPLQPAQGLAPIALSVGEPTHAYPDIVGKTLAANGHLYNRYPPLTGTPEHRGAIAAWLTRRYRLPQGFIDAESMIVPLSGTREGLFMLAQAVVPQKKAGETPLVLMPNPFYQAYVGAALATAGEARYVAATATNGFMPDFAGLDEATLRRAALVYLCSPSNPQGMTASPDYFDRLVALARQYDFVLAVDECYTEIYDRKEPQGVLEALARSGKTDNVVALHSLSKRSSVPGLRIGFIVGDPRVIKVFLRIRFYGAAGMPLPIEATAAALWRDEAHVVENRELYRKKIDAAERILSNRFGFYRPPGGFFLWLDVGDGVAATKKAWTEAAVRVVPGEYLARDMPGEDNPGKRYIRVALVDSLETTTEGLSRLAEVLG